MSDSVNDAKQTGPPEWVRQSVVYHIIPDRFARGTGTRGDMFAPWGSVPGTTSVMGGTLTGIIEHVPYLAELGVTTLCLTPIFLAATNHHMNPSDLYQIDPLLGDRATFHQLISTLREHNMHLMLDLVLTRSGRGFFAFQHVLEHGSDSPYLPWYDIEQLPIRPYQPLAASGYQSLWNNPAMPLFNLSHPDVQRYLLGAVEFWAREGVDGFCIDSPESVSGHDFWRMVRATARSVNPDVFLVGDIWSDAQSWLDGTQFDGVVNHVLRELLRDFVATGACQADSFATGLSHLFQRYSATPNLTILGNHATPRFLTEAHHDVARLQIAMLLQMTLPGIPCLYYGDEIGMRGGHPPISRGCFPWSPAAWDRSLRQWVQHCIGLRRKHSALQGGTYHMLLARATLNVVAFAREDASEQMVIVVNNRSVPRVITIPLKQLADEGHGIWRNVADERTWHVRDGTLADVALEPMQGMVLYRTRT